jgi:hypothetical protein
MLLAPSSQRTSDTVRQQSARACSHHLSCCLSTPHSQQMSQCREAVHLNTRNLDRHSVTPVGLGLASGCLQTHTTAGAAKMQRICQKNCGMPHEYQVQAVSTHTACACTVACRSTGTVLITKVSVLV